MRAFIIGNGESRKGIDIQKLRSNTGRVFGCNAIYRDTKVDVLVAVDPPMIKELYYERYAGYWVHRIGECKTLVEGGAKAKKRSLEHRAVMPDPGWSSGPIAAKLAAEEGATEIFLIGFDLGSLTDRINNLYKDTDGYQTAKCGPTTFSNWVKQLTTVFETYKTIQFIRIDVEGLPRPDEWAALPNVKFQRIPQAFRVLGRSKGRTPLQEKSNDQDSPGADDVSGVGEQRPEAEEPVGTDAG